MTIKEIQDEIIDEFAMFDDWMQRYEYIIELGKTLPLIDENAKTDQNTDSINNRAKPMQTKQATVTIDDQEWIVLDTDEPKENKVFCALGKPDSTIIWHTWVDINQIVGVI